MNNILADVSVVMLERGKNSLEAEKWKVMECILYCSYLHLEVFSTPSQHTRSWTAMFD